MAANDPDKEREIEEEYLSSLMDLNVNSKPLINMLTMLADDNIEYAHVIVRAVEKHLAKVFNNFKISKQSEYFGFIDLNVVPDPVDCVRIENNYYPKLHPQTKARSWRSTKEEVGEALLIFFVQHDLEQ